MRKLAALVVVLVGLAAFVLATTQLAFVVFGLQSLQVGEPTSILAALMNVFPLLAAVLAGAYLIYNRHHLAAKWFADEEAPIVDSSSLLRIGVLLLGLWLVLASLIDVARSLATVAQGVATEAQFAAEGGGLYLGESWTYLFRLFEPAVELALGLVLIRRSRRLSTWLWQESPGEDDPPAASLPSCPSCGAVYEPADYEPGVDVISCETCGERIDVVRA